MIGSVVLWDFDGTLAFRDGRWRGCLVEALSEIAPGHGVTGADVAPGLHDGFPGIGRRPRILRWATLTRGGTRFSRSS